jgi:hypothetical protein
MVDIVDELACVDAATLIAYPSDVVALCHKAHEEISALRGLLEEAAEQIPPVIDPVDRQSLIDRIQAAGAAK